MLFASMLLFVFRMVEVKMLPFDNKNEVQLIIDMPEGDLDEDALTSHLKERLVTYKIPKSVEVVRDPLRDDAGKTRRKTLREERLAR